MDVYRVLPDGTVLGLWSDEAELTRLGRVEAWRAGAVRWDARRQAWIAELATGERLGPFRTRAEAVAAERRRLGALLAGEAAHQPRAAGPEPPRPGRPHPDQARDDMSALEGLAPRLHPATPDARPTPSARHAR